MLKARYRPGPPTRASPPSSTPDTARARPGAANYPFCTIDPQCRSRHRSRSQTVIAHHFSSLNQNKVLSRRRSNSSISQGFSERRKPRRRLGQPILKPPFGQTDAIVQVVRCFDDPNIVHVSLEVPRVPTRDMEIINTELLMLADLDSVEKKDPQRPWKTAKNTIDKN